MKSTQPATLDSAALAFGCALLPLYPLDTSPEVIAERARHLAAAFLPADPGQDDPAVADPDHAANLVPLLRGWGALCAAHGRPGGLTAHDAVRLLYAEAPSPDAGPLIELADVLRRLVPSLPGPGSVAALGSILARHVQGATVRLDAHGPRVRLERAGMTAGRTRWRVAMAGA